MRASVGPVRALALAGVLSVSALPGVAFAQRVVRVSTVEVSPADAQVAVGERQFFLANAYDRSNSPIASATFMFTSSNGRVATVDANGIAVGVSPGTAIITARTGTGATAKSAIATLTVVSGGAIVPQAATPTPAGSPPAVTPPQPSARPGTVGGAALDRQTAGSGAPIGLRVRPFQDTLVRGEYLTLSYEALNANGLLAERVPLVFEVDSAFRRIVEVDTVGVIKALGDTGTATVRIVVPGNPNIQPRTVTVLVKGDSVRFSRLELWVPLGTVDSLALVVPAQDGRALMAPPGHFQFESSDSSKVRVNPMLPVFTASGLGTAQISGNGSAYYRPVVTVHVLPPVVSFRATPSDSMIWLVMNSRRTVTALPLAADSAAVTQARLTWSIPAADSNIARFDTATGTLRAVRTGETRLGVSAPYSSDSLTRRWWRIRVVAGGLAISRNRLGVGVNERTSVAVQMLDERRRPLEEAPHLRWSSADTSVARVENGQVRGVGVGRTRITALTDWDSTINADVFVSGQLLAPMQRGGRMDLYEFSADSAPRFVSITNDAAVELSPAFSPDLTRIAYVGSPADRPGTQEIFVANADGSSPVQVTRDSATAVQSPVFVRPNGEQIVFQSNQSGNRDQLYIINRDGTNRRALTTGENLNKQPDVSQDGRKVLFVSYRRRNYDIYEMNLDGTGERRLTTNSRAEDTPRYAPDGRSFFYLRDEGGGAKRVYQQQLADTTGATAQAQTPDRVFVASFDVSPDASLLVLQQIVRARGGDLMPIGLLRLATGAITPINVAAGELLSMPTFRPATPTPPAAPTAGPPR